MDPNVDNRLRHLETAFSELQGSVRELEKRARVAAQYTEIPRTQEEPATPDRAMDVPSYSNTQPLGEVRAFPDLQGHFTPPPGISALPIQPQPSAPSASQSSNQDRLYKVLLRSDNTQPTAWVSLKAEAGNRNQSRAESDPQSAIRNPQSTLAMLRRTEFWLNKVGIVLFLCGVAFLFKYAIDKQWITEEERLASSVLLGSVLLIFGLRLHASRRHFSQVLIGGAIAAYYITGYAAYNIFPDLHLPYEGVFGFMGLATLLAFVTSLWGDDSALSLIGAAGGFLTPFVLNSSEVHLPFLMDYTCLLLAGTSAIYIYRGWRSLLWTSFAGGWAILGFGWLYEVWSVNYQLENDLAYLQIGAVAMLVAFWAVPALHEVLGSRDPLLYRTPPLDFLTDESLKKLHLYIFTACTPFLVLAYTAALWIPDSLSKKTLGWVALGGAAGFALVGWLIRQTNGRLTYLHAMVAIGLLNTGLVLILEGNALLFALAAQAAILHLIAFRYKDLGMERIGILIFSAVGIWMVQRLVPGIETQSPALTNPQALTDLAVIGLAFGSSFFVRQVEVRLVYRGFAHVALLGWLWREIHGFPNGDGYVMIAWAAYGILMHLAARKLEAETGESHGTKGFTLRPATFAAHLAFEAAFGLLAYRLTTGIPLGSTPIFNQKAAIDLLVIGMALVTSFVVSNKNTATIYRLAVNAAVLAWLWREARPEDFTNGYVMLRWAAYTTVVAFVSHRLRDRVMLLAAAAPFSVIAALFVGRIMSVHGGSPALINTNTPVDLCTLALALAVSFVAQPREVSITLRLGFHAGVLALLWRELSGLEYGYYYLMLAWAIYAALLYAVALSRNDVLTWWSAHTIATMVGAWMLWRIVTGLIFHNPNATPVFNQQGLSELGIIALAAIFYCVVRREKYAGLAFGLWLHMAVLGWIWQELGLLPDGNGPVSIAWGVYALILIGASLKLERNRALMACGISTLFLVAAKLFLVDLVMYHIDVVWRILLFIGFGALFLLISYLFQNVAGRDERSTTDDRREVSSEQ